MIAEKWVAFSHWRGTLNQHEIFIQNQYKSIENITTFKFLKYFEPEFSICGLLDFRVETATCNLSSVTGILLTILLNVGWTNSSDVWHSIAKTINMKE